MRMAVVGAPSYFARRPRPRKPQDLTAHQCINLRLPTYGGLYAWEFEKRGRELKVRVEGQLVFNNLALRLNSALAGLGLAYLPEDQVRTHVAERGSSKCWMIGVRLFQATIYTIRAAGNSRRPSPCWSMRCDTAADPNTPPFGSASPFRDPGAAAAPTVVKRSSGGLSRSLALSLSRLFLFFFFFFFLWLRWPFSFFSHTVAVSGSTAAVPVCRPSGGNCTQRRR